MKEMFKALKDRDFWFMSLTLVVFGLAAIILPKIGIFLSFLTGIDPKYGLFGGYATLGFFFQYYFIMRAGRLETRLKEIQKKYELTDEQLEDIGAASSNAWFSGIGFALCITFLIMAVVSL